MVGSKNHQPFGKQELENESTTGQHNTSTSPKQSSSTKSSTISSSTSPTISWSTSPTILWLTSSWSTPSSTQLSPTSKPKEHNTHTHTQLHVFPLGNATCLKSSLMVSFGQWKSSLSSVRFQCSRVGPNVFWFVLTPASTPTWANTQTIHQLITKYLKFKKIWINSI